MISILSNSCKGINKENPSNRAVGLLLGALIEHAFMVDVMKMTDFERGFACYWKISNADRALFFQKRWLWVKLGAIQEEHLAPHWAMGMGLTLFFFGFGSKNLMMESAK